MLVLIKTNHFYKPSDLFKKGKRRLRDQDEQGLPPGYAAKLYPAPSKKDLLCTEVLQSSHWAPGSMMMPLSPLRPRLLTEQRQPGSLNTGCGASAWAENGDHK